MRKSPSSWWPDWLSVCLISISSQLKDETPPWAAAEGLNQMVLISTITAETPTDYQLIWWSAPETHSAEDVCVSLHNPKTQKNPTSELEYNKTQHPQRQTGRSDRIGSDHSHVPALGMKTFWWTQQLLGTYLSELEKDVTLHPLTLLFTDINVSSETNTWAAAECLHNQHQLPLF